MSEQKVGNSQLDNFEASAAIALPIIIQQAQDVVGTSSANKGMLALVDLKVAIDECVHTVTTVEKSLFATKLFQIGEMLKNLNLTEQAIELGFEPCLLVTDELDSILRTHLVIARCYLELIENRQDLGTNEIEKLSLAALKHVQRIQERIDSIRDVCQREAVYHIVFNALVVCLAICEPVVALGLGHAVVDHITLNILCMEAQLPLSVTKYLKWRERLYILAWRAYEQLGDYAAAKKVANRLRRVVIDLRIDEEQDPPIPVSTAEMLDSTQRVADAYLLKCSVFFEHDAKVFSQRFSQLFQSDEQQLTALEIMFQLPGFRTLVSGRSTVLLNSGAQREQYESICEHIPMLSKAYTSCLKRLLEVQRPEPKQDETEEDVEARFLLLKQERCAAIEWKNVLIITKVLFHFEDYESVGQLLELFPSSSEDKTHETEVSLVRALFVLKHPQKKQGVDELFAQVDGRQVPVQYIHKVASILVSCTHGKGAALFKRDPDLLTDAALFLWSPFCKAMIDTINASAAGVAIHPSLLQVTLTALEGIHGILTCSNLNDPVLRARISLEYAHLLDVSTARDSRHALQILRHSLQMIDEHRRYFCENGTGAISFTVSSAADSLACDTGKIIGALAALQADTLCLLYRIELQIDKEDTISDSIGTQVKSISKKDKTVTLSLKNSSGSKSLIEQRLLNETNQNHYQRALLLATAATCRPVDSYKDKSTLLSRAAQCLEDATRNEVLLLEQLRATEQRLSGKKQDPILAAPIILKRTCREIVLEIIPYRDGSKLARASTQYILYGKPTGSGTEVRLTNIELVGTGIPFKYTAGEKLVVTVRDLCPNETYVFAAAAFDNKGEVVGGIGKTTIEVSAVSPLPLLFCWTVLAKFAYASVEYILEDKRAMGSLHNTVREQIKVCKNVCLTSANKVVDYFVTVSGGRPLWQSNPLAEATLQTYKVLQAPQPVLQNFVHVVLLRNSLLHRRRGMIHYPTTLNEVFTANFSTAVFQDQIEMLEKLQTVLLGLHVSCALNDATLIMQVSCVAYQMLVPMLLLRKVEPRILQSLVSIQKALLHVPRDSWNQDVQVTYSCCCHEILRCSEQLNQKEFATAVLLPGVDSETADPAFEFMDPSRDVIHEAKALRRRFLLSFDANKSSGEQIILKAINRVCGYSYTLESEQQQEKVLGEIARARSSNTSEGLHSAWGILQNSQVGTLAEYLRLLCLVCKESLPFGDIPTDSWTEIAQHVLWDLSDKPKIDLVEDVLYEERAENLDPFEAVIALAYPLSEQEDPFGFRELETEDDSISPREESALVEQAPEDENDEDKKSIAENEEDEEVPRVVITKQDIDAAKERRRRRSRLSRCQRLLNLRTESPNLVDQELLIVLAQLELIRAASMLQDWYDIDYASADRIAVGDGEFDEDEMLYEGPLSDLKWNRKTSDNGHEDIPVVPRLGMQLGGVGEAGGVTKREVELRVVEPGFNIDRFTSNMDRVPELLHVLARSMVRSRWAQSWDQLNQAGMMLWNALQFAFISPTQFANEIVCVDALDLTLRGEIIRDQDLENTARVSEQDIKVKNSARSSASSKRSPREDDEEEMDEDEEGSEDGFGEEDEIPTTKKSDKPLYDWRPIWRACTSLLDMYELYKTATTSPSDVLWGSKLVSFCLQMLCYLQKWPELVTIGRRYITLTGGKDELCTSILPLLIHGQKNICEQAEIHVQDAGCELEDLEAEWNEKNKKRKRKVRKTRISIKTKETVTEAELEFIAERDKLAAVLDDKVRRAELVKLVLAELETLQNEIARDKNSCVEAIEKSQFLFRKAFLFYLNPSEGETIGSLIKPAGYIIPTRRSTQQTSRTKSERQSGLVTSRMTARLTQHSKLSTTDNSSVAPSVPDAEEKFAEDGCNSAELKEAVYAYNNSIQLLRQKQETILLAQALGELGDLNAARGGRVGWKNAESAWNDAVDAIMTRVDSVKNWRQIFSEVVQSRPATGIANTLIMKSPEMAYTQGLLSKFGIIGCLRAGINLVKLANLTKSQQLGAKREHERMATLLINSVFGTGMPHPSRTCDFACYSVNEIFPAADEVLVHRMFQEHAALVDSVRIVAREMIQSQCTFDNLAALPLLSFYEYLAKTLCKSNQRVLEARILKASALINVGMLEEAFRNICSVVVGDCLPVSEARIALVCAEIELNVAQSSTEVEQKQQERRQTMKATDTKLGDRQKAFQDQIRDLCEAMKPGFKSDQPPHSESNKSAFSFLVHDGSFKLLPYIAHCLGNQLETEFHFVRAMFLAKIGESISSREQEQYLDAATEMLEDLLSNRPDSTSGSSRPGSQATASRPGSQASSRRGCFGGNGKNSGIDSDLEECTLGLRMKLKLCSLHTLCGRFSQSEKLLKETMAVISSQGGKACVWWLKCRLAIAQILYKRNGLQACLKECKIGVSECQTFGEDELQRRFYLPITKAYFKLGEIKLAQAAVTSALEIEGTPSNILHAELLTLRYDCQSENANIDDLRLAVRLLEENLSSVGVHVDNSQMLPASFPSYITSSSYADALGMLCTLQYSLGKKLKTTDEAQRCFSSAIETISRPGPAPLLWLKAYVLTELGISSREPNQLVTAFMILVECGGYDTSLLKKLAIEIVVSTVNSGEIQLAFDWMKTVAKLGQMIELIRSEAPVFATAVPLQKDGMILHMTRGMASTFDTEGKNVQSLVYQYLSLLDSERLIAEDLECYEKCQALATFFVETLPKFKESCCFRKDLVPSGIQETEQGVWSISGQLQGSLEGSPPQVCVQWHCDDNKWSMYVGVINPTDGGTLLVEQKQMLWEDVRRMGTLFSRIRHEMEEAGESAPTEKYNADEAFASALGTLLSSNDEDIPTVPCVLDTVRLFEDAFDPSKGMLHVGETRELGKGKTAVDPTNESGDILVKWWNKFATHK